MLKLHTDAEPHRHNNGEDENKTGFHNSKNRAFFADLDEINKSAEGCEGQETRDYDLDVSERRPGLAIDVDE